MADKIFVDGMRFENPGPKAPEWVKGKIFVKCDKFAQFMRDHASESGWLNIDLKKGKSGALYLELNTWQKGEKNAPKEEPDQQQYDAENQDVTF